MVAVGARPIDALEGLRRAGVRRVDVLVVDGRGSAELVRVLRHRWPLGRVIDAADTAPVRFRVGRLTVVVAPPARAEVRVLPP